MASGKDQAPLQHYPLKWVVTRISIGREQH